MTPPLVQIGRAVQYLPGNLPDEASPWGETGSASGVKWTTAVYEMTHLYAVSPDDV